MNSIQSIPAVQSIKPLYHNTTFNPPVKRLANTSKMAYKALNRSNRINARRETVVQWRTYRRLLANLADKVSIQTEPERVLIRETSDMVASGLNCLPSLYHEKQVEPYNARGKKPPLPSNQTMPSNKVSNPSIKLPTI